MTPVINASRYESPSIRRATKAIAERVLVRPRWRRFEARHIYRLTRFACGEVAYHQCRPKTQALGSWWLEDPYSGLPVGSAQSAAESFRWPWVLSGGHWPHMDRLLRAYVKQPLFVLQGQIGHQSTRSPPVSALYIPGLLDPSQAAEALRLDDPHPLMAFAP